MALDNFSSQAGLYAKYRPGYPQELFDFILQRVNERQHAWDCATGPGQVAAVLSRYFEQVEASDISPQQLSHAPQKLNINYTVQPAEDTTYPDNHFDLITVAQAIHWFNFNEFYREVRRTGKPGGLLAVIGYGMIRVNDRLNPLIDAFYECIFGEYFAENRTYLDAHYRTIPFPLEEIKTPDFHSSYRWNLDDVEGYFNSWSAVQKMKEEKGHNPVDDIIKKLKPHWPSGRSKEVEFPVFARLGRITK